jgi:hypothetical protein
LVSLAILGSKFSSSYCRFAEGDAQDFKRLFENKEPVIDGKKVVIWTMQQLLAGSSFNKQIQENLNKSDFGLGSCYN